MNSVHEQCPNSDPKQCTVTKRGWVHTMRTPRTQVAGTLRAQCPCRGRYCTHSKFVSRMSLAQPAQVARMLGVHLSRHAQAACPQIATSLRCRDTKAANIMSRHPIHVATSSLLSQNRPGRDFTSWSQPLHVATSKLGRDLVLEIGSSHSSFCLAQNFFILFFSYKLLQ